MVFCQKGAVIKLMLLILGCVAFVDQCTCNIYCSRFFQCTNMYYSFMRKMPSLAAIFTELLHVARSRHPRAPDRVEIPCTCASTNDSISTTKQVNTFLLEMIVRKSMEE